MKLTIEQVRHVATLARLALSPEEEEKYRAQLSAILEHVEQLKALDTSKVEPTAHVADIPNLLRPDVVKPSQSPEDLLRNAPARVGTGIAVPKILEG